MPLTIFWKIEEEEEEKVEVEVGEYKKEHVPEHLTKHHSQASTKQLIRNHHLQDFHLYF